MNIVCLIKNFVKKCCTYIPDAVYLSCCYFVRTKKVLHLSKPTTFNEKMQWLKLYDRKSEYTMMVDKYEVKKYVADNMGSEYIIPTLGVWDTLDEIDFEKLANQYVLKCTHDSGGLVICRDKNTFDINATKKKIEQCLKRNYYWSGREWPYKNIKPRIIAEKYMSDDNKELNDFKFFCFNGKVKCLKIDFDRFTNHRANYYDTEMNLLPFGEEICPPDMSKHFDKPENFDKMIQLAEKLAEGIPFLRVDFYNIEGEIYFGELTFYPGAGFGKFNPSEWDRKLGDWLILPDING